MFIFTSSIVSRRGRCDREPGKSGKGSRILFSQRHADSISVIFQKHMEYTREKKVRIAISDLRIVNGEWGLV